MTNVKHESLSDIVALMRSLGRWRLQVLDLADRIEAAMLREGAVAAADEKKK